MKSIRVGISGWRYPHWRGRFYPSGLPQKRELAFASRVVTTIELNGSFYSLQRPSAYQAWYDATPRGFVFAVKGSRYITHMKKLTGVEGALANFFASGVLCLREKLGPFLWQLPPTLGFDADRLTRFFGLLPRTTTDLAAMARRHDNRLKERSFLRVDKSRRVLHALEVRHSSFVTRPCVELLRRHRIGLVVADTAGKWPYMEDVTAGFVYVRLHGASVLYASGYDDRALDGWAVRVRAWSAGDQPPDARLVAPPAPRTSSRGVYVYFDNDAGAHAPFDAQELMRRLARTGQAG